MTELIAIDTTAGVLDLIGYLKAFEYVTFDTETTGLYRGAEIIGMSFCTEETKAFYVILYAWNKETQKLDTVLWGQPEIQTLIETLHGMKMICHNGTFDCAKIEENFRIRLIDSLYCDTLILAHLLDENRRIGLKELAKTMFGESSTEEAKLMKESVLANGGKLTKKEYEMYKADSHLMAKYGAQDALLTYKLFLELIPELYEQGLDKFFFEDESMPLLRGPTYQMNTVGVKIDIPYLQMLKKTLEAECLEARDFIYKQIDVLVKDKYPGTTKKNGFNIGSSNQLAWLLHSKMGLEFDRLTDAGKEMCRTMSLKLPYTGPAKREFIAMCEHQSGLIYAQEATVNGKKVRAKKIREPWPYICTDKKALGKLAPKIKWVEKLLEYQKKQKILNTYLKGIESRIQYGVIYPSFLQHGTTSGRYACIAEGQMISMPGGDKPIEKVRPGDLVYCFTDAGKPAVRKVIKTFDNGIQNCVELTWKSQGSHKTGTLVCTPDHQLKTRDNRWVAAADLKANDRIYHLRRALNPVNGRARIYGPEYFMKNEEQLIKETYFGQATSAHAHHKNENKLDNTISNIEILPSRTHTSIHAKEQAIRLGRKLWEHLLLPHNRPLPMQLENNPRWIKLTRFGLLRLLAKAGGRPAKVPMDFNTFKRKATLLQVDLRSVRSRYGSNGTYLSRPAVIQALVNSGTLKEACITLSVSYYKLQDLCECHGLELNHKVMSQRSVGLRQVYDLEVEGEHNFIANELCVHNCRNPNWQNLPRDDKRVKQCVIARPGKVFVGADQSQLEPRIFSYYSQDPRLMAAFDGTSDFYSVVGISVYGKHDALPIKEGDPNAFGVKYKKLRDLSKVIALASAYGATAHQLAPTTDKSIDDTQADMDDYFEAFPGVRKMMIEAHDLAKKNGKVETLFGRPRRMPEALKITKIYGNKQHADLPYEVRNILNLACNHRIQGTGASIMNRAMIRLHTLLKEANIEAPIICMVHDSVIVECAEQDAENVSLLLQEALENTTKLEGINFEAIPRIGRNFSDV